MEENYDWKSKITLDRIDLISMAKGMKPNDNIPELIYLGSFNRDGEWQWSYDAFEDLTDIEIYNVYTKCKNSWKRD